MDGPQQIPEIVCLILCACVIFIGRVPSFRQVLRGVVGQKNLLRSIYLETEDLGRLGRSDIEMCLEART